jgi:hypothetical protein
MHVDRGSLGALLGIFMVGGIAVIASIIRLYALWVYTITKDVSYDAIFVSCSLPIGEIRKLMSMQILLLSQIEVNVAIICGSAPALRPLFNKTFMSTSYNRSNTYGNGYEVNGQSSNNFPLSQRTRSKGQIELHSFSGKDITHKNTDMGNVRNTSEEYILGGEGITKTVDIGVHVEESRDSHENGGRRPYPI